MSVIAGLGCLLLSGQVTSVYMQRRPKQIGDERRKIGRTESIAQCKVALQLLQPDRITLDNRFSLNILRDVLMAFEYCS